MTQAVDSLRQVGQLSTLGDFVFGQSKCSQPGFQGGQDVLSGEGIQLGCQSLEVSRARLVRAGELVGPLAQGSELLLNSRNLLTLGVFLNLRCCIAGGKRRGLLFQAADLLRQGGQVVPSGQSIQLVCQGIQAFRALLVRAGELVGLLAQGNQLLLNGCNLLTLGVFPGLSRCIIGGKRRGLLFQAADLLRQGGQVVPSGQSIQLVCQGIQAFRALLVRAGELVGLLAQGDQLILHGGNLLTLGVFPGLRRCIIGGKGRGLLVQGFDLLRQSGQLGALSSFILRRRKGSHLRLQGGELVGLFLRIGIGFPVGVLQGRHAHLIGVPCGGVLTEAPLDGDDVDHQENDNGEEGQRDGPVEQRLQEGRHLRTSFLLRHTCSPLRDEA